MRRRLLISVCVTLVAFALALPAGALAGGGSAGNQQYSDPFSGSGPTTRAASATSPTATATTTAPVTTAAAPPPVTATTPADPTTPTDPAATADPTATAATSSTTTLPYTGYAVWAAGALGATLLAVGLTLRSRIREGR